MDRRLTGSCPETGLWEAPNAVSKVATKVNPLWRNLRLVIALHSPNALLETGLSMCPPEKSRDSHPLRCRAVRSLLSGLSGKNREIRACFAYFWVSCGGTSLQLRLRGGEGGIRTPDTLSGMPVFKTGAINHSATSPITTVLLQFACFGSHSPYQFSLNSIDYKRWPAPVHRFSRPPVSTTHTSLQPIESTPVDS